MTPVIREPRASDADQLADLHVETWRQTYTHLLPTGFFTEEFSAGRRDVWRRRLAAPNDAWRLRVAELDGRLIGFAGAGPGTGLDGEHPPRSRQLYMLYVIAAHHGTGVGQALLDETLGEGPAMLWVARQNPRAIAFYEKNGFALDGVEQTDPGAPSIVDARMLR
jgi:GNAT superfamily N-acetyltransferase